MTSKPTEEEVIDLIRNVQACLETANLHFHKVASNSASGMEAFPPEDRTKDVTDLDLRQDVLPTQRALGVLWNLEDDQLTFINYPGRREDERSTIKMGPPDLNHQWHGWKNHLAGLESVSIERCYHPKNFGTVGRNEIHAFSDASKEAIGVAAYLKQLNQKGKASVSFVFGQAKVAPIRPTSIPRLSLCAAVLPIKAVKKLQIELDLEIDEVKFYTDSKVVLGVHQ